MTLTEEQQADSYAATDSNLYTGATTGSQKIAVGPVAAYATTLDKDAVNRHYQAGMKVPTHEDVVSGHGGERLPLSLANSTLFLDQWWTTDEQWKTAELSNVAVIEGQLQPLFEGNASLPGQWLDSFALGAVEEGQTIHGVSMNWDGIGMTIEASLDGTTWELAKRGVNLSIVPPGFDPTNKELQLRVKFPGGVVDDEAFLDNLNVVGVRTNVAPKVAGRTITFVEAYQEREYPPLQLHDNWGTEVGSGGSISISADTEEGVPARTLELWVRRTGNTVPSVSFTTSNVYHNAVLTSDPLPIGQWTLAHYVSTADITSAFTISGACQIGGAAIYETVLTADQVAKIYAQYTLSTPIRIDDAETIMVSESAQPVKIYSHDWTIEGAG